jgi:hypothetical protein
MHSEGESVLLSALESSACRWAFRETDVWVRPALWHVMLVCAGRAPGKAVPPQLLARLKERQPNSSGLLSVEDFILEFDLAFRGYDGWGKLRRRLARSPNTSVFTDIPMLIPFLASYKLSGWHFISVSVGIGVKSEGGSEFMLDLARIQPSRKSALRKYPHHPAFFQFDEYYETLGAPPEIRMSLWNQELDELTTYELPD